MAKTAASTKKTPLGRATLRDVARLAGCSTAVASTVVNGAGGRSGASEDLTQRIRKVARDLGYRPHFASRSLARRSTETIGVYVPPRPGASLGYRYEGGILVGIEGLCQQRGYDMLAINFGGAGTHRACRDKFAEGRIDGLLLLHVPATHPWVPELAAEYPNIVGVNYYGDARLISTVNFDDRAATRMAVEHLIALGHRRIGYLGTGRDAGPGDALRREGLHQAMRDAGLPVAPGWVLDYPTSEVARLSGRLGDEEFGGFGGEHFARMGEDRPTAVICYDDLIAASALLRLGELGVDVPSEISVVGIDDTAVCKFVRPRLTSVCQPLEQMGRRAAELAIDAAASRRNGGGHPGPVHELKPPKLVRRDSTSPPRRAFTLIELLIVVAILALLLTILMPSLSQAKDLALAAKCRSNMHHCILGVRLYAEDVGNEYLPASSFYYDEITYKGQTQTNKWVPLVLGALRRALHRQRPPGNDQLRPQGAGQQHGDHLLPGARGQVHTHARRRGLQQPQRLQAC